MMACSYLSAAAMAPTPEASGAACWTPPAMACPLPMDGTCMPAPYIRPRSLLSLQSMPVFLAPDYSHEPALDLTKPSTSLKSHLPSPPKDEGAE